MQRALLVEKSQRPIGEKLLCEFYKRSRKFSTEAKKIQPYLKTQHLCGRSSSNHPSLKMYILLLSFKNNWFTSSLAIKEVVL